MNKKSRGFTLIELMITVAIIGILGAVSYPSYVSMVQKASRSDGIDSLVAIAARMEESYNVNDTYANAALVDTESSDGYYTLAIATQTLYEYSLTATPLGWTDSVCGTLTYNSRGEKGTSVGSVDNCW